MFTPETIPPFSPENYRQYVAVDKPLLNAVFLASNKKEYPYRMLDDMLQDKHGRAVAGVYRTDDGQDNLLMHGLDGKATPGNDAIRVEFRLAPQELPFTLDDYSLLVLKEGSYELVIQQLDNSVPASLNYQYPATIYRTDLLSSLHPILGSFHRGDFETHFRAGTDGIGHGDQDLWSKPFQLFLVPKKP